MAAGALRVRGRSDFFFKRGVTTQQVSGCSGDGGQQLTGQL